jgi:hypothetical protein
MFGLFAHIYSFGQNKMIVDKPFCGTTYYGGYSKYIKTLTELPPRIQYNVKKYLENCLGSMVDSVQFLNGQLVDLNNYFKEDSTIYKYEWIVPKFDLNFILKDNSIGIKKYYIQVKLDNFGQLLFINWPKKHHSNKSKLENRLEIECYALKEAKLKGYNLINYEVDFDFNKKEDVLSWRFYFPIKIEKGYKEFDVIEISWNNIRIMDEYRSTSLTNY